MHRTLVLLPILPILSVAGTAAAQVPDATPRTDSTRAQRVEPVVVTATRSETPVAATAASVTRLSADDLRRLPARTVAEALRFVPGLVVLQADGLGDAPRLAVRGFYGGGETEYVTVLVNGVPLNGLAGGTVNWDVVPLASVQAIEVLRGGASSLYGDAAVGGVVNLITRAGAPFTAWRVAAGELGVVRGSAAAEGRVGGRTASVYADARRSSGFRTHERRDAETVGGSIALAEGAGGRLTLSALTHRRAFDEPGPLDDATLAASRRAVSPIYRFDDTGERLHRVTVDGTSRVGGASALSGYLTGEYGRADVVRTVPLSPQFADTKARHVRSPRLLGSVQLQTPGVLPAWRDRLVVGTDFSAGRLTSEYDKLLSGGATTYRNAATEPAEKLDAKGVGRRTAAAGFASWEAAPLAALHLTLGGRFDWMEDRYERRAPSVGAPSRATHVAFSPRAGANVRYLESARQEGHAYVTAGRSFKAPTVDQLFDQRSIPVQFPPYAITTSNPTLRPQHAASVEAGVYHRVTVVPGVLDARLTASAYQVDMRDELDFDLKTFRYVNIGRSRHRGVETGLTLGGPGATSAFVNYTQQDATSRYGEDAGRFLKAVPRRVVAGGVARTSRTGLSAALSATAIGETFLDDANRRTLPASTQLDARASYPVLGVSLSLDVRNLLGRAYSSTGFPDPAGGPTTYYYPAAGRLVTVGIGKGW